MATLLVKRYLAARFGIADFDAAAKAQGAAGIDIEARSAHGQTIAGELKTTKPCQPSFGAQQQTMMLKDLERLSASAADYRFMFVTDPDAFATLCTPTSAARAPGVEIVDLVGGRTFLCPDDHTEIFLRCMRMRLHGVTRMSRSWKGQATSGRPR